MNAKVKPLRALATGSPVAQIQSQRAEVTGELESKRRTLSALRMRRGELVLARKPFDHATMVAEIQKLEAEELGLVDALLALDAQERRALANQSRAEVEAYNAVLRGKVSRLQEIATRWQAICKEAGTLSAEALDLVDALRGHTAPYFGIGETSAIDRMPEALLIEFALAICPQDLRTGSRPYREALGTLPAVASYEVGCEFLRSGTATHQLGEIARVLTRELPADAPSPEAA